MKKTIAIATFCFLLAGCQSANNNVQTKPAPVKPTPVAAAPTPPEPVKPAPPTQPVGTEAMMANCMKELSALQQISPGQYRARSVELNGIVTQGRLYMQVRSSVSPDTQQIMDAAYQFKISRTCNQIRTDLTKALIDRAVSS